MPEIKTLKDILHDCEWRDELKAEAIKWVKDMQIKKHYMCADYFKHFFNITEEELK